MVQDAEEVESRGLTVVHRGAIEAIHSVVERLRAEGLDAMALDDPNFVVRLIAFGTYRVRVAVPTAQAEQARQALDAWDREVSGDLADWSRELKAQALLALIPTAVAGLGVLLLVPAGWRLAWLAGVTPAAFLGAFVLIAIWKRSRG